MQPISTILWPSFTEIPVFFFSVLKSPAFSQSSPSSSDFTLWKSEKNTPIYLKSLYQLLASAPSPALYVWWSFLWTKTPVLSFISFPGPISSCWPLRLARCGKLKSKNGEKERNWAGNTSRFGVLPIFTQEIIPGRSFGEL